MDTWDRWIRESCSSFVGLKSRFCHTCDWPVIVTGKPHMTSSSCQRGFKSWLILITKSFKLPLLLLTNIFHLFFKNSRCCNCNGHQWWKVYPSIPLILLCRNISHLFGQFSCCAAYIGRNFIIYTQSSSPHTAFTPHQYCDRHGLYLCVEPESRSVMITSRLLVVYRQCASYSVGDIARLYPSAISPAPSMIAVYIVAIYLLQIGYCVLLVFVRKPETKVWLHLLLLQMRSLNDRCHRGRSFAALAFLSF